jgi:hypothetical protein
MVRFCLAVFLCLDLFLFVFASTEERPPIIKSAAAEQGNAAAALVRSSRGGRGTSFCVHSAGLFLANYHVVGDGLSVSLILNSGTPEEKSVQGRVLRKDAALDIALIQAEKKVGGYAALRLGEASDLVERVEFTTFGFSYNPEEPPNPRPAVSAHYGRITSIQTEEGRAAGLDTDAILYQGASGGPLVGKQGRVLGIVTAGVPGKSSSRALPVNRIRDFLAEPVIVFEPLPILEDEKGEPIEFECIAFFADNSRPNETDVRLTLFSDSGTSKVVELKASDDGLYRAAVAPCAPDEKTESLRYRLELMRERTQAGLREGFIPLVSFKRGLLVRLTFSEGAGNQAEDSSGRKYNGTILGNPQWGVHATGGLIELDGSGEGIEFPTLPATNTDRSGTILLRLRSLATEKKELWLESGTVEATENLLRRGVLPGWPEAWGDVDVETDEHLRGLIPIAIEDGRWHEVALVRDAETGMAAMYIDGTPVVEGKWRMTNAHVSPLRLGSTRTGLRTWARFRGQLDAVLSYDRALSPGEIRLLSRKRDAIFGAGGTFGRAP